MSRRRCFCCSMTWAVPEEVGLWWEHINTPEYDEAIRTPEARERIRAYWAGKELEQAGMLF